MWQNLILFIVQRLLPDWKDAEAVRLFVLKVLGYVEDWAAATATQIDDAIVAAIKSLAASSETWAQFYSLVIDIIDAFDGDEVIPGENDPSVIKLADDAKLDPAIIIMLIQAAIELLKWWRERKNDSEAAN